MTKQEIKEQLLKIGKGKKIPKADKEALEKAIKKQAK